MTTKPLEDKNNEEVLLSFLERTKEGKYAPIDENALTFTRITEESERIDYPEEEYYYYSIG
ncbi:hypothetical protein ACFLU7_00010 [Chloroflexota bacterium]